MDEQYLQSAIDLAKGAHKGQTRWDGITPYFDGHVEPVALSMNTATSKIVAYLHDVVEDTHITLRQLDTAFPPHIVNAVNAITKRKGEKYVEYLSRVSNNMLATEVKLRDIRHNLSCMGGKRGSMVDKYELAIEYLVLKKSEK